jgi:hypothetical protein
MTNWLTNCIKPDPGSMCGILSVVKLRNEIRKHERKHVLCNESKQLDRTCMLFPMLASCYQINLIIPHVYFGITES